MRQKQPNPTDRHVGARVRMRRLMLDMSQEKLGDALDLTFQQVQKYEKGSNRIGASRLQQISHALQVPVSFFFEGGPNPDRDKADPFFDYVAQFLSTSDGLALVGAFSKIRDAKLRKAVVELVEQVARVKYT